LNKKEASVGTSFWGLRPESLKRGSVRGTRNMHTRHGAEKRKKEKDHAAYLFDAIRALTSRGEISGQWWGERQRGRKEEPGRSKSPSKTEQELKSLTVLMGERGGGGLCGRDSDGEGGHLKQKKRWGVCDLRVGTKRYLPHRSDVLRQASLRRGSQSCSSKESKKGGREPCPCDSFLQGGRRRRSTLALFRASREVTKGLARSDQISG